MEYTGIVTCAEQSGKPERCSLHFKVLEIWNLTPLFALAGINVAVVTAAGYPGKPERYAARFKGLLDCMKARGYKKEITDKFLVVGGECNYMFKVKVSTGTYHAGENYEKVHGCGRGAQHHFECEGGRRACFP